MVLNQHLQVGRINEPRNAKECGLYPEGIGDVEVFLAQEVAWSDLHFGKVSLICMGRLDYSGQGSCRWDALDEENGSSDWRAVIQKER